MLNERRRSACRGFTMVELMVTVAVLAILMAIAMPSFQTWMRNLEVRNATESITAGLQRARAEAVARNTSVAFVLGSGSSWTVSTVSPATTIDSRSSGEGSPHASFTILPTGAATLTYGNLGVVVSNADASASLTQVDVAATGATRPLRVTVTAGGAVRMCDPSLSSGSSPRAC